MALDDDGSHAGWHVPSSSSSLARNVAPGGGRGRESTTAFVTRRLTNDLTNDEVVATSAR